MPCIYCNSSTSVVPRSGKPMPTRDHVWPRSRYEQRGDCTVFCCSTCNWEKADMTLPEWLDKLDSSDLRVPRIRRVLERFPEPPLKKREGVCAGHAPSNQVET